MRFALLTVLALLALGAFKLPDWVMDSHPMVEAAAPTDSDYQAKARSLFHGTVLTHTGTQGKPIKRVVLTADDIAAALNFALLRKKLEGSATCEIRGDRLLIHASARLLGHSDRPWLNVRISATDAPASARIRNLRIGQINLPYPIGGWLVRSLLHVPPLSRFEGIGDEVIRDIHIGNERLVLTMNWDKHVLSQGGASITELADEKLLRVYYNHLAGLLNDGSHSRFVRLGKLMQPLFGLAKTRSAEGGDPIAENRAVIVILSAYTNGNDLSESLARWSK